MVKFLIKRYSPSFSILLNNEIETTFSQNLLSMDWIKAPYNSINFCYVYKSICVAYRLWWTISLKLQARLHWQPKLTIRFCFTNNPRSRLNFAELDFNQMKNMTQSSVEIERKSSNFVSMCQLVVNKKIRSLNILRVEIQANLSLPIITIYYL